MDNTAQLLVAQGLQITCIPLQREKHPASPHQGLCSTPSIMTHLGVSKPPPAPSNSPRGRISKVKQESPPLPRGRQDVILDPGGKLSPCTSHCLAHTAAAADNILTPLGLSQWWQIPSW